MCLQLGWRRLAERGVADYRGIWKSEGAQNIYFQLDYLHNLTLEPQLRQFHWTAIPAGSILSEMSIN